MSRHPGFNYDATAKRAHFDGYVPGTAGKLRRRRTTDVATRAEALHLWRVFLDELAAEADGKKWRMPEFTEMAESAKMAPRKEKPAEMRLLEVASARQVAYLSKDEVERFFAALPPEATRDRLLFDVIYRYGLRRTEAVLIKREHLKEGGIWITRLKGSHSGEYPIHPATRKLLWGYLAELGDDWHPYLFATRQSDVWPMSASLVYHLFRRYAEVANLPQDRWHPHVLRHSIATHLLNAGWDVADVQDWLGHRNIASTLIHAAVTNKRRLIRYEEALNSPEIANNASS